MANGITQQEFDQFRRISVKNRVDCMELYLIGPPGVSCTMQDVGARVYGDANYSQLVSLIHRCYRFSGRNSGIYGNGCAFEKRTGYHITRRDLEDFVRTYPNGTFQNGVTFEDFLLKKIREGGARQNGRVQMPSPARSMPVQTPSPALSGQRAGRYSAGSGSGSDDGDGNALVYGVAGLMSIALIVFLVKKIGAFWQGIGGFGGLLASLGRLALAALLVCLIIWVLERLRQWLENRFISDWPPRLYAFFLAGVGCSLVYRWWQEGGFAGARGIESPLGKLGYSCSILVLAGFMLWKGIQALFAWLNDLGPTGSRVFSVVLMVAGACILYFWWKWGGFWRPSGFWDLLKRLGISIVVLFSAFLLFLAGWMKF